VSGGEATARAFANIALAKYWGKSDSRLNLPAVPSISVTLSPLLTTTTVALDPRLRADVLVLDGARAAPGELARATALLDALRRRARVRTHARITSKNDFPTAAGLASSASGFAALAGAGAAALGLALDASVLSALARQASASSARSVFGGFVELPAGRPGDALLAARPLAPPDHWPELRVVIALAARGRKAVGSTDGMQHTERTSPYYDAWVHAAPALAREVKAAVRARDLARLGPAMEQSTLAMHASAIAARPGVLYWQPATLEALRALRELRERRGVLVFATMDAGPHVKALCLAGDARRVARTLGAAPGVVGTLLARPGRGLEVETGS